MTNPLISIIIPVYRTEEYLAECLDSVKKQTLDDFEAIIVNDATPDNAMRIAQRFSEVDSRFIIVAHDENKGLGAARNTGLDKAKGSYLLFLDSDDLLAQDALSLMVEIAEEKNADIIVGNMAVLMDEGYELTSYTNGLFINWQQIDEENLRCLPANLYAAGSVCHKLFRRELLMEEGIRFPEGIYWEDNAFSMEAWIVSKRIFACPEVIYLQRKRKDLDNPSITQTQNRKIMTDRDKLAVGVFKRSYPYVGKIDDAHLLGIRTLRLCRGLSNALINDYEKRFFIFDNLWYFWHLALIKILLLILNVKYSLQKKRK